MRLRIRHPNGTGTLPNVDQNDNLATLKHLIGKLMDVPAGKAIEVSGGYPPKQYNDDTAILSDCGLRDGDTLIVTLSNVIGTPSIPPSLQTQSTPNTYHSSKENIQPYASSKPVINDNTEAIKLDGGYLVVREMKDDNSCLFRSIGYALSKSAERTQELREVIAASILSDPITYSEAILGRPVDQYVEWILKPNSWGGAIELAIFSNYYEIEIDSFDVANGRVDKFGEGKYDESVLLLYTGIHYDVLALTPSIVASVDFDQTRFSAGDGQLLQAGAQLANSLRKQRKYTNTANFSLKCNVCGKGLIGERDATNHASQTGHTHFVEYI
ncbi:hypothetical protein BGW37DRAFT_472429 [Umbelopsis sp. PMI_123]|nr:hypothetical protein BGW37DRAFT_472429 [Umbelopsis sp. PMI_123]